MRQRTVASTGWSASASSVTGWSTASSSRHSMQAPPCEILRMVMQCSALAVLTAPSEHGLEPHRPPRKTVGGQLYQPVEIDPRRKLQAQIDLVVPHALDRKHFAVRQLELQQLLVRQMPEMAHSHALGRGVVHHAEILAFAGDDLRRLHQQGEQGRPAPVRMIVRLVIRPNGHRTPRYRRHALTPHRQCYMTRPIPVFLIRRPTYRGLREFKCRREAK